MHDNRFSVSDLTGYDYFRLNEFKNIDEYIRQLKREEPMSEKALQGIAVHSLLERMAQGDQEALEELHGGFDVQVDVKLEQPDLVELPCRRLYQIGSRKILLTGRVDALVGRTIVDYKTTGRINLEAYADSLQWRAYMDILTQQESFAYEVFKVFASKRGGRAVISEYKRLDQYRYDELHGDVVAAIAEFDQFLQDLARDGWIEIRNGRILR